MIQNPKLVITSPQKGDGDGKRQFRCVQAQRSRNHKHMGSDIVTSCSEWLGMSTQTPMDILICLPERRNTISWQTSFCHVFDLHVYPKCPILLHFFLNSVSSWPSLWHSNYPMEMSWILKSIWSISGYIKKWYSHSCYCIKAKGS